MAIESIDLVTTIERLGLALALGLLIGVERQIKQKMAGLRTNALVSLGAGGFVVFSAVVGEGDPTRIAAQVVSGIGFLGAGVILREGVNVHGLNTAATLWCSAMVGTFAGGGFFGPSTAAACFIVAVNVLLHPLTRLLNHQTLFPASDVETVYTVQITCKATKEAHMRSLILHSLSQEGLGLRRIESQDIPESIQVTVVAQLVASKRCDAALEQIVGRLSLEPNVTAATWQVERSLPE